MNGEADYYWPSSAQFTAVLHAIQIHTNLHEQNELDRYQPIVKILCSSLLSSNWFWASIILSSRLLGLVSTAAAAARLVDSTGIKQMVFGKDKAINRFYDLVMRGHFLSMCIRENCNAAKQQLKLPRSLTVFAIFCQSIMWPKKVSLFLWKVNSKVNTDTEAVTNCYWLWTKPYNASKLRVFVQNSWGCSKKTLTG